MLLSIKKRKTNEKNLSAALATAIGVTLVVGAGLPASAASTKTDVKQGTVQSCVEAIAAAPAAAAAVGLDVSDCKVSVTTTTTASSIVTAKDIAADTTLSATEKTELMQAAAAGAVRSKGYSQFVTGGAYTVTHGGRFYYDGARAWVSQSYRGFTGSHNCTINYAVGVSITINSCNDSGSTTSRSVFYGYTVNAQGIIYGYDATLRVFNNGTATGFGVTLS